MSTAIINNLLMPDHYGKRQTNPARGRIRQNFRRMSHAFLGGFYLLTVACAFLLAGAVIVVSLLSSPALEVRSIEIDGLRKVSRQKLLSVMDLWEGDNILSLNLEEIARRAMAYPWIREADIKRKLPDAISVRVVERVPIAIVNIDTLYYIDERGSIFASATPRDGLDYPVITGIDQKDALDTHSRSYHILEEAVGLITFVRRNTQLFPAPVSEIHIDPVLGLTMVLENSKVLIVLGRDGVLRKIGRLHMVLKSLEQEGKLAMVSRIDLNYPDRVVVRFNL